MKDFTLVFLVAIFLFCEFNGVKSQNQRKWLEIDNELYRIEPEGEYTWTQALAECKKEHSNLISPKGDYDYAKLKDAIKHNFDHYSHFWTNTQVKWTNFLQQIGLGKNNNKNRRCNKFDNSTTFKFLPDDCEKHYGFICHKPLLKGVSSFYTDNIVYVVQPDHQYTCEQAYNQCDKHKLSLVVLTDFAKKKQLQDYIFINYGSSPSFWFGYNNETHYNCATFKKGQHITNNSTLGFICQKEFSKTKELTMRHLILIGFVGISVIMAIFVYVCARCCCHKRLQNYYAPEMYYPEDVKVTDMYCPEIKVTEIK